jgi:hypothetical protein
MSDATQEKMAFAEYAITETKETVQMLDAIGTKLGDVDMDERTLFTKHATTPEAACYLQKVMSLTLNCATRMDSKTRAKACELLCANFNRYLANGGRIAFFSSERDTDGKQG